jgi:hypothetical protein
MSPHTPKAARAAVCRIRTYVASSVYRRSWHVVCVWRAVLVRRIFLHHTP